jgi:hypothetical protein
VLSTIDETCDFISEWLGEDVSLPGPQIDLGFAVPNCVVRLNERIGGLWRSAKPQPGGVLRYETPLQGLLGGQDQIREPSSYVRDADGIVPFVSENQGVWELGFLPGDPDQLFAGGDWGGQPAEDFPPGWRPLPAKPEDALVCTLLVNLCFQSDAEWDDAPKPEAADTVLWEHPAWPEYYQFWTNKTRTLIAFGGWQVTRRSTH